MNQMLYEGKAKKVFATDRADNVLVVYKDDATAFNGLKKGTIKGKGVINNQMSNAIFKMLEEKGIPTHFIKEIDESTTLVRKVQIVPVEVVVRNVAAGSLCKRLGLEWGQPLASTVLEYSYKNDELGDPMINATHVKAMNLATDEEMQKIDELALKINTILVDFFLKHDLRLIDFKLEFGRFEGSIILADEISPDTCRLWDAKTGEKMDKDRFRQDLGGVEEAYIEVARRILGGEK